jgi:hypothetical protein
MISYYYKRLLNHKVLVMESWAHVPHKEREEIDLIFIINMFVLDILEIYGCHTLGHV